MMRCLVLVKGKVRDGILLGIERWAKVLVLETGEECEVPLQAIHKAWVEEEPTENPHGGT